MYLNKKSDIPKLTDKEYYFLSQNTYSTDKMKEAFKERTPIESKSNKAFLLIKLKGTLTLDLMRMFLFKQRKGR